MMGFQAKSILCLPVSRRWACKRAAPRLLLRHPHPRLLSGVDVQDAARNGWR